MILDDGVNTLTVEEEDITENPIQNSNVDTTIGFFTKVQADAQKLEIESRIRITQDQYMVLNSILTNFGATKYYTPARRLAYKEAIEELQVVITGAAKIDQRVWNGEIVFYLRITMEEANPL